jgi:hypothetical protein
MRHNVPAPLTDIPMTGLGAYIANLAQRHSVAYVKTGSSALAKVITHLADDDVTPDKTERLVIALRRANAIDGPTMVTLLGRYFDEQKLPQFVTKTTLAEHFEAGRHLDGHPFAPTEATRPINSTTGA